MKLPNLAYHSARAEAATVRRFYRMTLPMIVRRSIPSRREIPIHLFSYSGEAMLPEQVASIRSFFRYVGRPKECTIFSDGSHTPRSIDLLQQIDPIVRVSHSTPPAASQLPATFRSYLETHPTGKQLALVMSLPGDDVPALYIDSDVLFFRGASDLLSFIERRDVPAFYLPDCKVSADERLFRDASERMHPVNTGFLLLFQALDWSLAIQRFVELEGTPDFFTNQTLTHLVMHANGAQPLDPERYVLQLDDQFVYGDRYAKKNIAARHYVNPVRHKLWTSLFR